MPRLGWECYRSMPSNSLIHHCPEVVHFRGFPGRSLPAGRRWLREVRRQKDKGYWLDMWGEGWFSFMESAASAGPFSISETGPFISLLKKGAHVSWGKLTPHTLGRSLKVFCSDGNQSSPPRENSRSLLGLVTMTPGCKVLLFRQNPGTHISQPLAHCRQLNSSWPQTLVKDIQGKFP